MLGYQLFYHVKRSKKSDYSETKFYAFEKEASKEAIQLCMCSNVDFVSVRFVEVKSINLTVLKKSDTIEINEPYKDLSCPKLDFEKIDISDLSINTFNEYYKENFDAK